MCVEKTDRAPPLPVNNFYDTKQHCAPMIFIFSLLPGQNLSDIPSNWTPKRVALPIMIIEPTYMVEG